MKKRTGKVIEISNRRQTDPIDIDPEALLPILREWRTLEPEKYRTIVNMICVSYGTDPERLRSDQAERGAGGMEGVDALIDAWAAEIDDLIDDARMVAEIDALDLLPDLDSLDLCGLDLDFPDPTEDPRREGER